jgi:hypothetical protein
MKQKAAGAAVICSQESTSAMAKGISNDEAEHPNF